MLAQAVRLLGGTAAVAAGGWVLRALRGAPAALGASPLEIRTVAKDSPQWRDGVFVNAEPASPISLDRQDQWRLLRDVLGRRTEGHPEAPVPLAEPEPSLPAGDLGVTWFGHSSALIEVDGYRILADPIWSDRCSPSRTVGPRRLHPVPVALDALPAIDAVVISHDHYDHLDVDTITVLAVSQRARFFVPLGVGAHLRSWGVPPERIVELDWHQSAPLGELTLVCTPARHFSGRFLNRNVTLWSSWAIIGPRHRAFFGGDTGYGKAFADIGAEYGPFGLTLMPVGAYHPSWPDIHMNPEEAVRAHRDVTDGGVLLPVHWATFRLAPHPWAEPVERMISAAAAQDVAIATPRPGERVDLGAGSAAHPREDPWWRGSTG